VNQDTFNAAALPESFRQDMQALADAGPVVVPQVQEVFFTKQILPLFAELGQQRDLTLWAKIAGNLLTPIDVVDATGAVLFRAPAPLSNTKSFIGPGNAYSVGEVMLNSQLREQQLPGSGARALQEGMARYNTIEEADLKNRNEWKAIFDRYGLSFPYQAQSEAAAAAPTVTASPSHPALSDEDEEF